MLFCRLTAAQRDLYRSYLASSDVAEILDGKRHALAGAVPGLRLVVAAAARSSLAVLPPALAPSGYTS